MTEKMKQSSKFTAGNIQELKDAMEALFECRRTVKFFYVKQVCWLAWCAQPTAGRELCRSPGQLSPIIMLYRAQQVVCLTRHHTHVHWLELQYTLEMAVEEGVEGAQQAKLQHDLWMDPFVTAVDRLSEMIENPVI